MLRQILQYFSILIFLLGHWNHLGYCALSEYLAPDITQILMDAHHEGLYTVRVLEGEVESTKRLLVLLGEPPHQSLREKEMGVQILSKFSCIGHENYDYSKIWGGVCFKWWLDATVWGSRLLLTSSKLFQNRMGEIPVEETWLVDVRKKASLEHFSIGLILALERYFNHIENYPLARLWRLVV